MRLACAPPLAPTGPTPHIFRYGCNGSLLSGVFGSGKRGSLMGPVWVLVGAPQGPHGGSFGAPCGLCVTLSSFLNPLNARWAPFWASLGGGGVT